MKYYGIKGVILEYDGAVDIRGYRWAEVLHQAFSSCGVELTLQAVKDTAEAVGTYLLTDDLIQPTDDFTAMMRTCVRLMLDHLHDNYELDAVFTDTPATDDAIVRYCLDYMNAAFEVDRTAIAGLAQRVPLVLVSRRFLNFGPMLDEFGLSQYFRRIVWHDGGDAAAALKESADAIGVKPPEIVVIGSSLADDVVPALSCGCRAILMAEDSRRADSPSEVAVVRNLHQAAELIL